MTECRVVVVREIGNLTAEQGKWLAEWIADPLDGVHLVLVAGGGRIPAALDKAAKAHAEVVGPATEQTADVLAARADATRTCKLAPDARRRESPRTSATTPVACPSSSSCWHATYGDDAALDRRRRRAVPRRARHRGPLRAHERDRPGDVGAALEMLHRMLTATSASAAEAAAPDAGDGDRSCSTTSGCCGSTIRRSSRRSRRREVLGMKSAGGARFPLEAAKRLGTDGLREAMGLLAQAELDLRGASGLDERTVIDVLVARLAALSRRFGPDGARAETSGRLRAASSGARCGGRPRSCG